MTDFDPSADSRANYTEALREIRRRKIIAGEIQPITDEEKALAGRVETDDGS